ncbi:MAG: ComEC/Rec2 family competence protein [Bacteroidales bacterium]
MLTREIPFLRLTVPLCAGVLTAECFPHIAAVAVTAGAIGLAVMTVRILRSSYIQDIIFGSALLLFMISSGYLLRTAEKHRPSLLGEERQEVTLRLSGYPTRSNNGCSFRARIISVDKGDSVTYPRGSLQLWFMTDTLPSYWKPGDILRVQIRPVRVENNGNPCEFNYRRWLEGQGIRYMAFFRSSDITGYTSGTRRTVRENSLVAAHRMTDAFRRAGLQGEELGLVMALTIGDKELLEKERLTSFSRSGAMHIMAVSGLHVGMISMALSWLLFFLKGRLRWIRSLIIVPALWGFAFLTGMSPSVLRATIMFTFLQAGYLLNRQSSGMNSLLASAFILTAVHPGVIFEAGFQLSYLAVGFIIAFYNSLYRLLRLKNRIADYLWQMTAVSLVAQAGTLALSVRLFNIFPLLFLITNIVVIPISFVVLAVAMLLLIVSPFPPVASLCALILDRLAGFTLGFTGLISSMQHGVIMNIGLSASETLMLTGTTALLLAALLRTAKITLKPALVAASLLLICNTFKAAEESHRDRIITYNIRGDELQLRQYGRRLLVPADGERVPAEVMRHACTRGLKIERIEPG